jgi:hypothetical protein
MLAYYVSGKPTRQSGGNDVSVNISAETTARDGHGKVAPTRPPVVRRTMNDVADGLLLDVREMSITDLKFTDEDSALSRALRRILKSNGDGNFHSFNSSI